MRARRSTPAGRSTRCSNVADWFGRPRPPQGDPVRQRRNRLRHHDIIAANAPITGRDRDRRHARRHCRGDPRQRQPSTASIRAGSTDLATRPCSRRPSPTTRRWASVGSLQRRTAAVAGQPAHAVRRDRRLCRRQPQRLRDRLRSHRRRQQLVLRAGVLSARPRRGRKFHKIDVRVTRPGLTVRARKGYVTPKEADRRR